ncbi:hypothetical protein PF006_g32063 [Phytophthora fragariae]|uniref:Endonuclease/exonuclease/phosphatase domain-containing protein n=1 Tax=Phytophthora fragariae TaxID=53985 RepID=A0A6A3PTZ1_9STRA|nr:hypothetical protein PF006_g32063 [Phytophthora fragariae]
MYNYLDQTSPSPHLPGMGREDLYEWLDALGLMDAWRFVNPDVRDYTSPTRKNRLDYCFLSVDLLQHHLIKHVRDRKWHNEDHVSVEIRLQAKFLPKTKRTPWRCPIFLFCNSEVQKNLFASAEALAVPSRSFWVPIPAGDWTSTSDPIAYIRGESDLSSGTPMRVIWLQR